MLTYEEYKKALGEIDDEVSEEEILERKKIQEDLAEIFFPVWLEKRKRELEKFNLFINQPNKIYESK